MEEEVQKTRRRLPHWRIAGATYFLTWRVLKGTVAMHERLVILNHVRSGDAHFYDLLGAVVMPDHAHAVLAPQSGCSLSRITKGIKGVTAHLVNASRGTTGHLWQDESFDRIIRDQAELTEKLNYMINNPTKAGLVDDPWDYEALYVAQECGS
jgi:REP element-mobilizing transposase RayT